MTASAEKVDREFDAHWASDPVVPPEGRAWDLLVIGGGTAGIVAARTAAGFGASVLMAEEHRTGGDCLWTGCVPSKTLLASAHRAHEVRTGSRFGVTATGVEVDFDVVMDRVHEAIATIEPEDSPNTIRRAGASVVHARAQLTGTGAAEIDGHGTVTFRRAVIATGSRPAVPPVPGLAEADPLTSDTVWSLRTLPDRLLVLGGGSTGCELAQAFARLGSRVTLVEVASRLLSREEAAAARMVQSALVDDGVELHLGTDLTELRSSGGTVTSRLSSGATITADRMLVAVGRTPRTEGLGLDAAGVEVDGRGHVVVDRRLRTSNRRIWAAGDVTGHPPFTHVAGVHGSLAAANAVLGVRRTVDPDTIPRVTYTQPELAAFGSPGDAEATTVRDYLHDHLDRAITEGTTGRTRLVFDARRRLVGATVVSPRAGELIIEPLLAARRGLRATDLAGTMHPYPGYSDAVWKPSIETVREQLDSPTLTFFTRRLLGWQRFRSRFAGGDATRPPR